MIDSINFHLNSIQAQSERKLAWFCEPAINSLVEHN
jgi:hypothetical protein